MNKIIVLPGSADAIFFLNEVDYIIKNFDDVVVMSYPGNTNTFSKIAKEKGFRYFIIKVNILKSLIKINFYKWLFDKNTRAEIKNVFSFSKQGLLKLLYIMYYGLFYINAKKLIDREVEKNPNDNIYMYSFWLSRGAYTIANYSIKRENNIKRIISRAHGYDLYEERNKTMYLPFREFINKNLDEICFISDHGLNYFNQKYKNNIGSCDKNVSRLGTFNPLKLTKMIKPKNKICIASCSSIIPIKRLDLIIDIISRIDVPVEWIHIGTGTEINVVESYARQKINGKEYHFLGYIENTEILSVYEKYDVDFLLNMSDSEGIPVSIMEGMSMGIPTIARNVGGINEIVNMNTGLLIEDINNMELVYNLVNEEAHRRIWNMETYKNKHDQCKRIWDDKYNADNNYNIFFKELKES